MRLTTMLFGACTLVGIGVYVGKKYLNGKDKSESVLYAEEKETFGEKVHKASMFAVGAVKTEADKVVEGFKDIKNQDMVKKGEEAVEQVKMATENIIKDIEDLKNMVVSVNISVDSEHPDEKYHDDCECNSDGCTCSVPNATSSFKSDDEDMDTTPEDFEQI